MACWPGDNRSHPCLRRLPWSYSYPANLLSQSQRFGRTEVEPCPITLPYRYHWHHPKSSEHCARFQILPPCIRPHAFASPKHPMHPPPHTRARKQSSTTTKTQGLSAMHAPLLQTMPETFRLFALLTLPKAHRNRCVEEMENRRILSIYINNYTRARKA